jgi:gluconate transporter
VQPFVAFVISSLVAAVLLGMPLQKIPGSIEHGIGDLLGSLAAIIIFGAMYGKLIADSGAAQRIAATMLRAFGTRRITFATAFTGFIVGLPLFYNVGFVILVPLIFSITAQSKLSPVYLGIPLLAGLSIDHGFLPPHPSPAAIVSQFHADLGLTLLYGMIVGIPTILITGPLFAQTVKNIKSNPSALFTPKRHEEHELPGTFVSFFCALLPVGGIAIATAARYLPALPPTWLPAISLASDGTVVMLFSLLVATWLLGVRRGMKLAVLMDGYGQAVKDIAVILLIVAGAGALKQVFLDSGADAVIGRHLEALPVHPLILGWFIAMIIRICLGSATAAGLTAAGLVYPIVQGTGVNPNLMVLAIGAGSMMCSHVNDSGFWLFKEYFNVSLKDTFRSWTLMETLVGVCGITFVMMLNAVV